MALYLGTTKCKLLLNNVAHVMTIYPSIPVTNDINLATVNDETLLDADGASITVKEED